MPTRRRANMSRSDNDKWRWVHVPIATRLEANPQRVDGR